MQTTIPLPLSLKLFFSFRRPASVVVLPVTTNKGRSGKRWRSSWAYALKAYLNSLTESEDIAAVQYGMDLPEPYATELAGKLAVAQEQMEAIMQRLGGAA